MTISEISWEDSKRYYQATIRNIVEDVRAGLPLGDAIGENVETPDNASLCKLLWGAGMLNDAFNAIYEDLEAQVTSDVFDLGGPEMEAAADRELKEQLSR